MRNYPQNMDNSENSNISNERTFIQSMKVLIDLKYMLTLIFNFIFNIYINMIHIIFVYNIHLLYVNIFLY